MGVLLKVVCNLKGTDFRLPMQTCFHQPLHSFHVTLLTCVSFSAGRLPPPIRPEPSPPFNEDYPQQLLGYNDLRAIPILETRRRICYNQIIYNDVQIEGDEWICLSLQIRASTATTVTGIDHTAIKIIDDDG